jgi:hypothetical protein
MRGVDLGIDHGHQDVGAGGDLMELGRSKASVHPPPRAYRRDGVDVLEDSKEGLRGGDHRWPTKSVPVRQPAA